MYMPYHCLLYTSIPRNLLEIITTPIQKASSVVASKAGGVFDQFLNAKNNADENEKLKKEIAELNQKLVDYEELKDENEQLKAIAGIKDLHSDFKTVPSFVVSRDPSDRYGSFLIDQGSLQGCLLYTSPEAVLFPHPPKNLFLQKLHRNIQDKGKTNPEQEGTQQFEDNDDDF